MAAGRQRSAASPRPGRRRAALQGLAVHLLAAGRGRAPDGGRHRRRVPRQARGLRPTQASARRRPWSACARRLTSTANIPQARSNPRRGSDRVPSASSAGAGGREAHEPLPRRLSDPVRPAVLDRHVRLPRPTQRDSDAHVDRADAQCRQPLRHRLRRLHARSCRPTPR